MISILFVLSLTCLILFIPTLFGINMPAPILHIFSWSYANSYVYSSAVAFQIWFWSDKFGVI